MSQILNLIGIMPKSVQMEILDYDSRFVIKNGEIVFRDGKMLIINSIDFAGERFELLNHIPLPEVCEDDLMSSYLYLKINEVRDYFLVSKNTADESELQIQILEWGSDIEVDTLYFIEGYIYHRTGAPYIE